jgi:hypothetical protein
MQADSHWMALTLVTGVAVIGLYLSLSMAANIFVIRLVNNRIPAPIHRLLDATPPEERRVLEDSFPLLEAETKAVGSGLHQHSINWRLTTELSRFMLARALPVFFRTPLLLRGYRAATPRREENLSRLRALELRQQDNCLFALTAFAAATEFTGGRTRQDSSFPAEANFIISYFSPLIFGFMLCLFTFCSYALHPHLSAGYHMAIHYTIAASIVDDEPSTEVGPLGNHVLASDQKGTHRPGSSGKFPLMICVVLWFVEGLWYLHYTLGHDFAGTFRNYIQGRTYPATMTRLARQELARTPDIIALLESKWIPAAIGALMLGLVGIYAGFLHSL